MMLPPTPFYKSGKKIRKQGFKFPVTWEVGGEILTLGEKLENLPSGVAQKSAGVAVMARSKPRKGLSGPHSLLCWSSALSPTARGTPHPMLGGKAATAEGTYRGQDRRGLRLGHVVTVEEDGLPV